MYANDDELSVYTPRIFYKTDSQIVRYYLEFVT